MASRTQGITEAGFNAFADTRGGGGGPWSANSISPGDLPLPPGFLTPEQVAQRSIGSPADAPRTISVEDFLTAPTALVDPKLGS